MLQTLHTAHTYPDLHLYTNLHRCTHIHRQTDLHRLTRTHTTYTYTDLHGLTRTYTENTENTDIQGHARTYTDLHGLTRTTRTYTDLHGLMQTYTHTRQKSVIDELQAESDLSRMCTYRTYPFTRVLVTPRSPLELSARTSLASHKPASPRRWHVERPGRRRRAQPRPPAACQKRHTIQFAVRLCTNVRRY